MSGLREKKKKQARERILSSARELILKNGFEKTTTDQITEMAEISIGTLYNHFRTKEDVFFASLFDNMTTDQSKDSFIIPSNPTEILPSLIDFSLSYITQLTCFDKGLLRELIKAGFNSSQTGTSLLSKLMALDMNFLSDITGIVNALDNPDSEKELEKAQMKAEILFGILSFEFLNYIYSEDYSFELMKQKIKGKILLLFA